MKIQIRQTAETTSQAEIRNHAVLIDRPVEKGGTDAGPMGGELFLASIGGCFMSTLLAAVKARNADVCDIQTDVIATLDGTPSRFTGVELLVSAECKDRELLDKLVEIAERGCIMMNTLRGRLDVRIRTSVTI